MKGKMEHLKFTELNDWRERVKPLLLVCARTAYLFFFFLELTNKYCRPETTGNRAGKPPYHCSCNLFK